MGTPLSSTVAMKSRVRTGCLTCRSRKVKCDEERPQCFNCIRLKRACLYEHSICNSGDDSGNDGRLAIQTANVVNSNSFHNQQLSLLRTDGTDFGILQNSQSVALASSLLDFDYMTGEWGDIFELGEGMMLDEFATSTLDDSLFASQALTHEEVLFPYFTTHVNPPFITPWDSYNWIRMRIYMAELGARNPTVAAAVRAVEGLYQGLSIGNDAADAMPQYFRAKTAYLSVLKTEDVDMELVLITTFLLCCFEVVAQQETVSNTLKQKDAFITRLEQWTHERPWSPVSLRIIAWLRLFHTKALHLGGRGILGPRVLELLTLGHHPVPTLSFLENSHYTANCAIFDSLTQSLSQFYFELQDVSTQVSALNRHHRSRGSSADELVVNSISIGIDKHLEYLWQARPTHLQCSPAEVSVILQDGGSDAENMSLVIMLCKLCYYAETLYHSRAHGLALNPTPEVLEAKSQIRIGIELATHTKAYDGSLHPAFMWPLFLYSVESFSQAKVDWALSMLQLISDPLWHTEFMKNFIRDLTTAQLQKGERVDSRYFCVERYGVLPPFV